MDSKCPKCQQAFGVPNVALTLECGHLQCLRCVNGVVEQQAPQDRDYMVGCPECMGQSRKLEEAQIQVLNEYSQFVYPMEQPQVRPGQTVEGPPQQPSQPPLFCDTHSDQPLKFHCQLCKTVFCKKCFGDHRDHQYTNVRELDLEEVASKAGELAREIEQKQQALDRCKQDLVQIQYKLESYGGVKLKKVFDTALDLLTGTPEKEYVDIVQSIHTFHHDKPIVQGNGINQQYQYPQQPVQKKNEPKKKNPLFKEKRKSDPNQYGSQSKNQQNKNFDQSKLTNQNVYGPEQKVSQPIAFENKQSNTFGVPDQRLQSKDQRKLIVERGDQMAFSGGTYQGERNLLNNPHGFGRIAIQKPGSDKYLNRNIWGHFSNGSWNGYFIIKYAEGRERQGFFKNGNLVGAWICKNKYGDMLSTQFETQDKPKGKGELYCPSTQTKRTVTFDEQNFKIWFYDTNVLINN